VAGSQTPGIDSPLDLSTDDRFRVQEYGETFQTIREAIGRRIVGQENVIEELLLALLAEGHALIVGVPGLAKTLLVSTVSDILSLKFKRIQFTPDLMPSDITGATIIGDDGMQGDRALRFLHGPIFANILLADEINRTPPKTQAALMEAMEERQVTAGGKRHVLERPFFVLATQNPIEQEGTYPLPVSQLDRFLFNIVIDYPAFDEEFEVLELTTSTYEAELGYLLDRDRILEAIELARRIEVSEDLVDYATRIVRRTRPGEPDAPDFVREWVSWGGGPRAVQSVILGAKSRALLNARTSVNDEDIHRVVFPSLRHRVLLNYHGEAEDLDTDEVIEKVLLTMPDGRYQAARQVKTAKSPWSFLTRWFGI